jgi:kinesin family protein C2/C3
VLPSSSFSLFFSRWSLSYPPLLLFFCTYNFYFCTITQKRLIPRWKNVNEQLLTLRECNYDLQDAIIFAEINWGYKVGDTSTEAKLERAQTRAGFVVDGQAEENLGVLSTAAARKIDRLQVGNLSSRILLLSRCGGVGWEFECILMFDRTFSLPPFAHIPLFSASIPSCPPFPFPAQAELNEAKASNTALQAAKADEEVATLRTLKRENTKLDAGMMRSDRKAEEADLKIKSLTNQLRDMQAKLSDSERERVAAQADVEKIGSLEAQVQALQKGGGDSEQALKKSAAEMDRMRTENTHLKMKVQQLKEQLDSPVGGKATVDMLKTLHAKVLAIRKEKDSIQSVMKAETEQVQTIVSKAMAHTKGLEQEAAHKLEEITMKYRAEVLQRKLLYNKLQELNGNIRVFLRVRRDDRETESIMQFPDEVTMRLPTLQGQSADVEFDKVFGPKATQEEVYKDTNTVIMSVLDGYNVCLMAYGQTGAGKTYTMMGTPDDPGVNRRAITELLRLCTSQENVDVTLSCSLAEVYNENVYDLLSAKRVVRKIKQGIQGVYAEGLIDRPIGVIEDVTRMLKDGDRNRSVAATSMNTDSSRSHLILTITVKAHNAISGVTSNGKLTLVDLAGSERIARSEATGERLIEAAAINKSLSALGQVFSAISDSAPHVPYRNSKLTHLLQDSLGGDSKTCMFINASPLKVNLSETHSTLSFGKQIRKIELGPAQRHTNKPPAIGKLQMPGPPKM